MSLTNKDKLQPSGIATGPDTLDLDRRARAIALPDYWRQWRTSLIKHAVLIFFGVFFIFPLIWMLVTALKTDQQVLRYPPTWIPDPWVWRNFPDAFFFVPFGTYLKNSLLVAGLSVVGVIASSALPAYAFARLDWPGRDVLFILVISTIMLPFQVTMIPLYVIFNKIGWINTLYPLIVPHFFGNAFFIFLLRQFFRGIPRELSDAAVIDGASELRIFWEVILPLSRPVLMVVALFQFLNSWNDFLVPLIYLNDRKWFTISLGLAEMRSAYGLSRFSLIMAATSLFTVPVIILFFFAQRSFIQGITFTGMKG